ncbi:hypothetical protein BO78DRAFT_40297 [Aspergillus sclerotiicarbonarius CBS 121057]|uniref:Uncharacterized protein n=1 Tax=Aspergillus sclerotiicarbonarius (strain CBS 121057 / IBT 28362) TaxID=1448318 RepID=A0A319DS82_ASPSB|nr:hypothetical protein BO78DRAFT_40297 [Aspergillus sclerotiicarbonarius CBS 121057]
MPPRRGLYRLNKVDRSSPGNWPDVGQKSVEIPTFQRGPPMAPNVYEWDPISSFFYGFALLVLVHGTPQRRTDHGSRS